MAHFAAWLIFTAFFGGIILLLSWIPHLIWSASPWAAVGISAAVGAAASLLFIASHER